ncbi:MAG: TonB-dependent receptor, partial [Bacteroidota bacterium]
MNSSFNTRFPLFNCLAASLFLLAATFCSAHNGTIRGMALDSETRLGLAGANVELVETGKFTATDELGIFTFADLPSGVFTINVSYLGYAKTSLQIEVRDHETTAVKIPLSPEKIDLPAVEIQVAANANLRTINALDIQTRPVNSSQDILRLVPGLVIAQHAGGGKAEQIFLRGFDLDHGTDIQITVDGLPVNMVSHAHGQGYADLHF